MSLIFDEIVFICGTLIIKATIICHENDPQFGEMLIAKTPEPGTHC
jgi:hypothetical protein